MFQISRKDGIGETLTVDAMGLMGACATLSEEGRHQLDIRDVGTPAAIVAASPAPTARERIQGQHDALRAVGVAMPMRLHGTVGDATSHGSRTWQTRAGVAARAEHDRLAPAHIAAEQLREAIESEEREDRTITAGELGRALSVNGKITVYGLALTEHAIRGLALRLESPMTSYVVGLRDRIVRATDTGDTDGAYADRRKVADVIAYECSRAPDVPVTLRTRKACQDVFAIVSPSYTPADAPALLAEILPGLPRQARGSWAYDPASTAWELRAQVWTPTPEAEHAVGEAFNGYVSFKSKDAGNGRLRGGGGVTILSCTNSATYCASTGEVSRTHRKSILVDVGTMLRQSVKAIDALCASWGVAREQTLEVPSGVKISDAIPGFWRYCLTARGSDLAGVLPGRTEEHVKALTIAWEGERRDRARLVKSDMAQGWTRYVQGQPGDVRRDAESAIGAWLVSRDRVGCDVRDTVRS